MAEARIFYKQDCDIHKLDGKTVAIIGYGSQGHAHALNLQESGVNVVVGLYEGSKSWAKAEKQGLKVMTTAEAAKIADVIMILIPDEKQKALYESDIKPYLTAGKTLAFAHGFNIDSLTVSEPENPKYSRITISLTGDKSIARQIIKQLNKLYNVKEVEIMEKEVSVYRELALIKLRNSKETRQEIMSAVDIFRSKIVDFSPETLCVEITGETSKIEAFISLVQPLGILEMCRTGVVAIERGSNMLNTENT